MAEKRQFQMHSRLLYDVILRQAGTLAKAILEGVMNSVDAGATTCEIVITNDCVTIVDNGKGFRSRDEIIQWFEVFGQPHEEAEGKTFGRFRMGRGQLFAYGVNEWQTNQFQMSVDVKHNGLDYKLQTMKEKRPGCIICVRLYDKLLPSDLQETCLSIKRWCRWIPIDVQLNDESISLKPEDFDDWTTETPEAYVALDDSGQLRIFNQGAFVMEYSKGHFGVGGEIITKVGHALKVNFARNDIQSDCPIWRKLKPMIDQRASKITSTKHTLDDAGRTALRRRAGRGELDNTKELRLVKIFTAVTGRSYTLNDVSDGRFRWRWTVAPRGNRQGDNVHRSGMAFVLAKETLDDLGMSPTQFQTWASQAQYMTNYPDHADLAYSRCWHRTTTYVPFAEISAGMSDKFEILTEDRYTQRESLWMDTIKAAQHDLRLDDERDTLYGKTSASRRIVVGISEHADGWTDGRTYIALNRNYLVRYELDIKGLVAAGCLLLHECCHRESDLDSHDHDQAFYELYHDSSDAFLGTFVQKSLAHLPNVAKRQQRKLTKRQLRAQDAAAKATISASVTPIN